MAATTADSAGAVRQRKAASDAAEADTARSELPAPAKAVWSIEYLPWQIQWYRGVLRKDAVWTLVFAALMIGVMHRSEDPRLRPYDHSEWWRLPLTACGAILAWLTSYCDVWRATPPEQDDEKRHLLEKNMNGHYSYLTVHIIMAFNFFWSASLIAELAWYTGITDHPESVWSRKLVQAVYTMSGCVAGLGCTLMILFLKFNWFEKSWRMEILEVYHRRGFIWFGPQILFTHCNQTPISLLDITIIKNKDALRQFEPAIGVVTVCIFVFGVYYILATHINHYLSGGRYPYPFLRVILAKWSTEIAFVLSIIVFLVLMTALMLLISSF